MYYSRSMAFQGH